MVAINTPALVILLGSTPALVELELCRHMLSLSSEDCHRVAFVHIDTDEEPSEIVAFREEHQGLFRRFRQRIEVPEDIRFKALPREVWHTYIPPKMPQSCGSGAMGIRNNGHAAAAFNLQYIVQVLEAALQSIEALNDAQNQRRIREVHVNIVAFLGGGTGSGILGDVTIMVKRMLSERQYRRRINLFCILPDWVKGANDNDIDQRRSNATACLLELIALSLVADTQKNHVYQKYMLDEYHNLTDGTIANEVYLIGRTSTGSIDGTARIVGLDLFQRITDASGIGRLEHSQLANRLVLDSRDDRELPTMFGSSCPQEVLFPLQEVAKAYAQISASYLLPLLASIEPPPPDITDTMREDWKVEWESVATLVPGVQGIPLAVVPSEEFSADELSDVEPETLDAYWTELERRQKGTVDKIKSVINQKRGEEVQQITTVPPPHPQEHTGPIVRKINHLRLLQAEYELALHELKSKPVDPPPEKPEWRNSWLYSIPYFGKLLKQRAIEHIRQTYNDILEKHAKQTRYNILLGTLEDLLKQVQARLNDVLRWFSFGNIDLEHEKKDLVIKGYTSAAWHGKLANPHPHQRHIFQLVSLCDNPEEDQQKRRNLAAERLYLLTTFTGISEQTINQGIKDKNFVDSIANANIKEFIQMCTAYLVTGELGDDAQTKDADLELQSKKHLVGRVVAFFYDYYIGKLYQMNLFELLRLGSGQGQTASTSDYLYEHLKHIRELTGSLIEFQQTLLPTGVPQPSTSVYLGMNWRDGKQKGELDQAISRVGTLTARNQTPMIQILYDLHRLQVSHGQHGISLSTMQEFYRDSDSTMAEYISHQREWYGNRQPAILPDPSSRTYGSNNIPVHNCGDMERWVCDPSAFKYSDKLPHATRYGTSLIGRVIRDTVPLGEAPTWNGTQSGVPSTPGSPAGLDGSGIAVGGPTLNDSSAGTGPTAGGSGNSTTSGGTPGNPSDGNPGIQPLAGGPPQGGAS